MARPIATFHTLPQPQGLWPTLPFDQEADQEFALPVVRPAPVAHAHLQSITQPVPDSKTGFALAGPVRLAPLFQRRGRASSIVRVAPEVGYVQLQPSATLAFGTPLTPGFCC